MPDVKQRFLTLETLVDAHRAGVLPPDARVLIDADGAFVEGTFHDPQEEVFAGDLPGTLRDALALLGLRAEVIVPAETSG